MVLFSFKEVKLLWSLQMIPCPYGFYRHEHLQALSMILSGLSKPSASELCSSGFLDALLVRSNPLLGVLLSFFQFKFYLNFF